MSFQKYHGRRFVCMNAFPDHHICLWWSPRTALGTSNDINAGILLPCNAVVFLIGQNIVGVALKVVRDCHQCPLSLPTIAQNCRKKLPVKPGSKWPPWPDRKLTTAMTYVVPTPMGWTQCIVGLDLVHDCILVWSMAEVWSRYLG